uniref:G_PROTEIN_RECEP_F1_2 domain-containing protein n=1 Tax=Rhabditophanes sp. KR3021 TaxID=114890 RepID=A0AC35UE49_9BILA
MIEYLEIVLAFISILPTKVLLIKAIAYLDIFIDDYFIYSTMHIIGSVRSILNYVIRLDEIVILVERYHGIKYSLNYENQNKLKYYVLATFFTIMCGYALKDIPIPITYYVIRRKCNIIFERERSITMNLSQKYQIKENKELTDRASTMIVGITIVQFCVNICWILIGIFFKSADQNILSLIIYTVLDASDIYAIFSFMLDQSVIKWAFKKFCKFLSVICCSQPKPAAKPHGATVSIVRRDSIPKTNDADIYFKMITSNWEK